MLRKSIYLLTLYALSLFLFGCASNHSLVNDRIPSSTTRQFGIVRDITQPSPLANRPAVLVGAGIGTLAGATFGRQSAGVVGEIAGSLVGAFAGGISALLITSPSASTDLQRIIIDLDNGELIVVNGPLKHLAISKGSRVSVETTGSLSRIIE